MLGYNFTENFTLDVAMEISKMSETIYTAAALGKFVIKVISVPEKRTVCMIL